MSSFVIEDCLDYCKKAWSEGGQAVEGLKSLIRVPNLSPAYDTAFLTNGLINKAIDVTKAWIESQNLKGLTTTVYNDPGREPLLKVDIPSFKDGNKHVLCYGHLDKMPHLDAAGWSEGLSATNPVIRGPKIYGRGTNDDGYNSFLIITALRYLQEHDLPHPKITILLETGEESGDEEITKYLHDLRPIIGEVDLVCILDAESQDYETVWCCTSLRGVVTGVLSVKHLSVPCHSGMATGIVPDTFRIARHLVSRIEDSSTGEILLKEAHVNIPQNRIDQCHAIANHLGKECVAIVSPLPGAQYMSSDLGDCLVGKGWRPGLAITGQRGIPEIENGSNVIRTETALKLSLRIPPGVDANTVQNAMKKTLEENPPYGATVEYIGLGSGNGWYGKDFEKNLDQALKNGCKGAYGKEPMYYAEGGSIPLCNTFQELWSDAEILVSGCAGPDARPHGYDESLDLPYTIKFNAFVASLFNDYAKA